MWTRRRPGTFPARSSNSRPLALDLTYPVIVVVGPTASGKSGVAAEFARRVHGEVVSADSMQVYRGMDIGTGKITPDEQLVTHHGLDICNPGEAYSASRFQEYARACFADIDARGSLSVLAGGTGFYVRAAIDDYDFASGEQVGNPVRDKWQAYYDENGADALWNRLHEVDPKSADIIHPNNVKRVIRAFEMLELDGKGYAQVHAGLASIGQFVPAVFFGLAVTPDLLVQRIERRVDAMFDAGLVAEVEGLLEQGFESACTARDAIGYKEVVAALRGEITMDEAREQIKTATRRYAKRQRSWWRKDSRIIWLDADDPNPQKLADEILKTLSDKGYTDVVCRYGRQ